MHTRLVIYEYTINFKVVVGLNGIPFVFSTTLLLYKIDILLLKEAARIQDIMDFIFNMSAHVILNFVSSQLSYIIIKYMNPYRGA